MGDPVFLRTPKGVVPTARALALAEPIGQVLAGARRILATAAPFDPRGSSRSFTIGAPDGATAFLLPLLARLRRNAPGVNIRLRQLLPRGGRAIAQAWEPILGDLDARVMDIAIGPFPAVPARFDAKTLFAEDFVIISRPGHDFAKAPGLSAYCAAGHLVVSLTGDAHGFVDDALAERGLTRRVVLTVPGFFMALALVATTDLLAAIPRSFALAHCVQAGVVVSEAPLPLPRFEIRMVVPRAAMMDDGLAWLGSALATAGK